MNTTIISILLGIGGMFGWGIYDFLGGVFAKQIGSFKSFFWSQLAGLISVFLLAFVFPVIKGGERYTLQEQDFFRKFKVGAAFPMHARAGDAMYLDFRKSFEAQFPGLSVHVPMSLGQKFVYPR